ncbi:MAG: elongation factor 1-beta [Thermoplasmata archaeon]|nr:elongation factor 1-beta [Thermoplasmata archaeon]MCK4455561.1 elongation factor 1-beta [Thermoplasmata archaeon]
MGDVAITYRLMPSDVDVDLEGIKERAMEILGERRFHSSEVKPIAFGLEALEITAIIEEVEGLGDRLEGELGAIEGVQSIETVTLTRL